MVIAVLANASKGVPETMAAIQPGGADMSRSRTWRLLLAVCLIMAAAGSANLIAAATSAADSCDTIPTGIDTSDHWLHFKVPAGLMPDKQFDGRPAKLQVHRVVPVYAHGKCPEVPTRAAVLIHGRTASGSTTFDLQQPAPEGGSVSVQEGLARAGIDTFAPSLLGYGHSTRFDEGLDDPGNASLPAFNTDGICSTSPQVPACDRTHNPVFQLDQQGKPELLYVNPLAGQRRPHSSNERFARTDVWVRDIRQVIDDAIARAQPTDGKVTLLGYSLGAMRVGRALYAAKFPEIVGKVNRVVFLAPFFFVAPSVQAPTEETPPPTGFVTFPLTVSRMTGTTPFEMPPGRDAVCTGHIIDGTPGQVVAQTREQDNVGREWGGDDPAHPAGLNRSPTFSSYGWNSTVAGQLTPPTLVMQGLDDTPSGVPGGATNAPAVYNALPASMTNKVLVQVGCASHGLMYEGCSQARCTPVSGTPYGGAPGKPWVGPHSTVKAALIEWITSGTFNGAPSGKFTVSDNGVASVTGP
jgi:pimeloyl-ACP methyl ester carboxylesterase